MKEVKKFIIASLVIMLLKIVGGLLCSSYTLIESAIYELLMIVLIILTSTSVPSITTFIIKVYHTSKRK